LLKNDVEKNNAAPRSCAPARTGLIRRAETLSCLFDMIVFRLKFVWPLLAGLLALAAACGKEKPVKGPAGSFFATRVVKSFALDPASVRTSACSRPT
jgi:hypothetical protein